MLPFIHSMKPNMRRTHQQRYGRTPADAQANLANSGFRSQQLPISPRRSTLNSPLFHTFDHNTPQVSSFDEFDSFSEDDASPSEPFGSVFGDMSMQIDTPYDTQYGNPLI